MSSSTPDTLKVIITYFNPLFQILHMSIQHRQHARFRWNFWFYRRFQVDSNALFLHIRFSILKRFNNHVASLSFVLRLQPFLAFYCHRLRTKVLTSWIWLSSFGHYIAKVFFYKYHKNEGIKRTIQIKCQPICGNLQSDIFLDLSIDLVAFYGSDLPYGEVTWLIDFDLETNP